MRASRTDTGDHIHCQMMPPEIHELMFARIEIEMTDDANAVPVAVPVAAAAPEGSVSGIVLSRDTSLG